MKQTHRIELGLFAKFPETGRVKTRLAPLLGEQGAARFARWLLLTALKRASTFTAEGGVVRVNLWTEGGTDAQWKALLEPLQLSAPIHLHRQVQGHLGERMQHATQIQLGASHVSLLLGPDAIDFSQTDFQKLLNAVEEHGLAFTPAHDGGYVAFACVRPVACIFSGDIQWGTNQVAEQTQQLLKRAGLQARWLSPQADIDEPADLQQALARGSVPEDWMNDYSDDA